MESGMTKTNEPVAWVVALPNQPITMTVPVAMLDKLAGMHNAPLFTEPVVLANEENRYAPYGIIDPDYARVYTQAPHHRVAVWLCLLAAWQLYP